MLHHAIMRSVEPAPRSDHGEPQSTQRAQRRQEGRLVWSSARCVAFLCDLCALRVLCVWSSLVMMKTREENQVCNPNHQRVLASIVHLAVPLLDALEEVLQPVD